MVKSQRYKPLLEQSSSETCLHCHMSVWIVLTTCARKNIDLLKGTLLVHWKHFSSTLAREVAPAFSDERCTLQQSVKESLHAMKINPFILCCLQILTIIKHQKNTSKSFTICSLHQSKIISEWKKRNFSPINSIISADL